MLALPLGVKRHVGSLFAVPTLLAAIACELSAPQVKDTGIVALVTPSVAVQLDENGIVAAPEQSPQSDELASDDARTLAQDWVKLYAPWVRPTLEAEHGSTIALEKLVPCGRVFYASSSFQPLAAAVPATMKRAYGSFWIVTLCDSDVPQVLLSVSATASHLFDLHAGRLPPGTVPMTGNEYAWRGIPEGQISKRRPTPEDAIRRAATWSSVRVASLPELVTGGPKTSILRWKVKLERRVGARSMRSGLTMESDEIYVGPIIDPSASAGARVVSADPATIGLAREPRIERVEFFYLPEPITGGAPLQQQLGVALVRPDRALALEPVTRP